MGRDAWDRYQREPAEQYESFCVYLNLGISRTIPQVAEITGRPIQTLWNASRKYHWVKRCAAYDEYIERKAREALERKILQVKEASVTAAQKMMALGIKKLNTMNENELTAREAKEYVRNSLAIVQAVNGENQNATDAVLEMPNDNDVVVYLPEIEGTKSEEKNEEKPE